MNISTIPGICCMCCDFKQNLSLKGLIYTHELHSSVAGRLTMKSALRVMSEHVTVNCQHLFIHKTWRMPDQWQLLLLPSLSSLLLVPLLLLSLLLLLSSCKLSLSCSSLLFHYSYTTVLLLLFAASNLKGCLPLALLKRWYWVRLARVGWSRKLQICQPK